MFVFKFILDIKYVFMLQGLIILEFPVHHSEGVDPLVENGLKTTILLCIAIIFMKMYRPATFSILTSLYISKKTNQKT